MIQLTRLNNSALVVNSDLIKFVEQAPDTVITLLNGEKILVRESAAEVTTRVVRFRQRVLAADWVTAAGSGAARPPLAADDPVKEHPER
jgi:flagellar protein FlbD